MWECLMKTVAPLKTQQGNSASLRASVFTGHRMRSPLHEGSGAQVCGDLAMPC